jgi:acetyltransferase-like isoleucine patch superfamily enzyme
MSLFERFATPIHVVTTLGMYVQMVILGGIATAPGAYLALHAWDATAGWPPLARVLAGCCLGWSVYFAYAICVVFVVGAFRVVTRAGAPLGSFPYYSFKAMRWANYNALILMVRYTSMNFIRVTPFLTLFHWLMGMRIGRRVQINTCVIGDSNLIEIGDDSVIGGDVTLVAHAAERGRLVTAPVKIGSRVTIGVMSVIFPGVTIGDGATVAANAVVTKGTTIGAGESWGGVPARRIK